MGRLLLQRMAVCVVVVVVVSAAHFGDVGCGVMTVRLLFLLTLLRLLLRMCGHGY